MQLESLLGPEMTARSASGATEIAGITADSRQVRPGWLFAAMPGSKADGARFVPDAIAKGAAAILVKEGTQVAAPPGIAVLTAAEPRQALARMAARFYPAQPDTIVAVTGTSGKTSVADFARQIFAHLGRKAASLGTIGLVKPDGSVYGGLTTPDPVTLHKTLAELAAEGVTHLAFEASSHGLDQHRLDGVRLKAAAFTNLGRDHLDYHPSMEAYLAAKLRLFTELLPPDGTAVVNADAEHAPQVIAAARERGRAILTVGRGGEALKLASLVARRLCPAAADPPRRRELRHPPAPARRLPGRQRAPRRGSRHCRRRARRPRPARACRARGRERPARDRGQRTRRPHRHRLRAQAGRAGSRAHGAAPLRPRPARVRVRLRRRPRQGQAADHGAHRGTPRQSRHRHRRQPPQRAPRGHPRRDPGRLLPARARSATAPRPSAPARACSATAICC